MINVGLFFNTDNRDGMEASIGGIKGRSYRATLNSYMYSEAYTLSKISTLSHNEEYATFFANEAKRLKELIDNILWDKQANFYKVVPKVRYGNLSFMDVRELHGTFSMRILSIG
jgi:hypothetical protein